MEQKREKTIFHSYSRSLDQIYLRKEHGEIPYYFAESFGYRAIVDDYYDVEFPDNTMFRTVELQSYKYHNKLTEFKKVFKILRLARKIDILYLLSITPDSMFKILAYRLGGGKGKVYVKLDLDDHGYMKNERDLLSWKTIPFYLKIPHFIFKRAGTVYTVESKRAYERLKKTYYGDLIQQNKLYRLPNCFDPHILEECGVVRKPVHEKEKIIITAGRLGAEQKNTELMLDILSKIDLNGWKVYLIGPLKNKFEEKISEFYSAHPHLKDSIIFTGKISQKEKYEYFNRARVFLFTSCHEGFAFALVDAAYMKNYIISTDVGGAEDMLEYTGGILTNLDDLSNTAQKMAENLQRIVLLSDNELDALVPDDERYKLSWNPTLPDNKGIQILLK